MAVSDILTEAVKPAEPPEAAPVPRRAWGRWPKWVFLLIASLWLADTGISLLIQHSRLRRKLTARLEAAFGRPVEVGSYDFSLWGGPTLEAQSVIVGEDPRFGHEYFLRAESLTIRLRWQSLLLGRLELGTLSLTHPSLNLVRNPEGDWNLAEWLPRPSAALTKGAPTGPPLPALPAPRFSRIEVDAGRINFKRGDEKLPFAFTGVKGYVERESPGQWRMDLDASPSRAAVILQQAGTLHLAGHVGGTSSRLRPAVLELSWTDASITDVLRLARSYDYGLRGSLALSVSAHTQGDAWTLQGRAEMRQLHRWDLPLRADNPALNLSAKARLDPQDSRLELMEAALEAPHSNASVTGSIDWHRPAPVSSVESSGTHLQIASSGIGLEDVLAWVRAFHSDVADDIALRGRGTVALSLRGWPPRLDHGALAINDADLTGNPLRVPVRISPLELRYDANGFRLSPVALSFGPSSGSLRIESSTKAGPKISSSLRVIGNLTQVRDLFATASALGWNLSHGWDLAGPVRCDLRWQGAEFPWQAQPVGTIEWGGEPGGASLRVPFLNQPVEQIKGRADLKLDARHVTLSSAQAFGARWSGTLERRGSAAEWQFALAADRLAGADLDHWLNPRWRQSFLDRMLPFLNPRSPSHAVPENLRARGQLRLDQFTLAPLIARRLQGDLKIEGRRIEFTNANAQFYGGSISGSAVIELEALPAYHIKLDFSQVDLYALSAVAPGLANLFAGSASGEVSFDARGASRAGLLASLECQGATRINDVELRNLSLADSFREGARRPGVSTFREASAAFTCGEGKLEFQDLLLLDSEIEIDGSGSVDFSRNLDFRLRIASGSSGARITKASNVSEDTYKLSGPLAAPRITRVTSPPIHR